MEKAFVYEFTIEELRKCLNGISNGKGDRYNGTEIDRWFSDNHDVLPNLFSEKFIKFKTKKFMEEIQ